jgi:geranylgeranyl reductase family protein
MLDRFDIVIVGAGPAGCRAAITLARHGARVALVDGSHPREKPCGGGVTGRALAIVEDAIDITGLTAARIEGAGFVHRGREVRMSLDASRLVVVSRRVFDGALLASAVAAGATLVPYRAIDVRRDPPGWLVATRQGSLTAEWLLGADGPGSLVRRRIRTPFERADLSIAAGFFVGGRTAPDVDIAFESDPPGYLWSFPRPDHLAIGVCAQADESTPDRLRNLAARWIAARMQAAPADAAPPLEPYSWPIPSLREESLAGEIPAGDGWMLLGDAAGLVDPITREGIYFALWSGAAAADALKEKDPADAYARALRAIVYPELTRAARLKARFFRPEFMGLLVTALRRSARIRAIMADLIAGEQPYRGLKRRLLGTLEWKLMLELWRARA